MKITHSEGGSSPLVTLTNSVNFSLTLCDLGAAIYEMRWEGIPLTIAEKDLTKYVISSGYFGKTAGRIAGRVKKGFWIFAGNGSNYPSTKARTAFMAARKACPRAYGNAISSRATAKPIATITISRPTGRWVIPAR